MEWNWYLPILTILAGFIAGVINTVAGSGSVVTISMLVYLGLPPTLANGTNRVGVFVQTLIGTKTYVRDFKALPPGLSWQAVPAVAGAITGSLIAVQINEKAMNMALLLLMVLMLVLVLAKPGQWLRETSEIRGNQKNALSILLFFLIGVHGGFVQAGVGIFLLSALVLLSGYNINTANAVKLIIVTAFTLPALLIFIWKDQVVWKYGLLMAAGQSVGAYVAARFAMTHPRAKVWIRNLLVVVIIASIFKFLQLYLQA